MKKVEANITTDLVLTLDEYINLCVRTNELIYYFGWDGTIDPIEYQTIYDSGQLDAAHLTNLIESLNDVIIESGYTITELSTNYLINIFPSKIVINTIIGKINEIMQASRDAFGDRTINFEDIISDENHVKTIVSLSGGRMYVHDIYDTKVMRTYYLVDGSVNDSELAIFGTWSLYERDIAADGELGNLIRTYTTPTIMTMAVTPTGGTWIPYHGVKTYFEKNGGLPPVVIDGTEYNMLSTTLDWIEFKEIRWSFDGFGVSTPAGVPFPTVPQYPNDSVADFLIEYIIRPNELVFDVTMVAKVTDWYIGYFPMISLDISGSTRALLNTGQKYTYESANVNNPYYSSELSEYGFSGGDGYVVAMITNPENELDFHDSATNRHFFTYDGSNKVKLYYDIIKNIVDADKVVRRITKYVWGKSDTFEDLYDSATSIN